MCQWCPVTCKPLMGSGRDWMRKWGPVICKPLMGPGRDQPRIESSAKNTCCHSLLTGGTLTEGPSLSNGHSIMRPKDFTSQRNDGARHHSLDPMEGWPSSGQRIFPHLARKDFPDQWRALLLRVVPKDNDIFRQVDRRASFY